jgi:hypothetical protein
VGGGRKESSRSRRWLEGQGGGKIGYQKAELELTEVRREACCWATVRNRGRQAPNPRTWWPRTGEKGSPLWRRQTRRRCLAALPKFRSCRIFALARRDTPRRGAALPQSRPHDADVVPCRGWSDGARREEGRGGRRPSRPRWEVAPDPAAGPELGGEPPSGSEGLGGRARGPLSQCPAAAIPAAASRAEAAGLAGAVDEVAVVLLFRGEGVRGWRRGAGEREEMATGKESEGLGFARVFGGWGVGGGARPGWGGGRGFPQNVMQRFFGKQHITEFSLLCKGIHFNTRV